MKVLFCHDGPLRVDSNQVYYGIAHNNDMFSRYYSIAENLSVAIRLTKIGDNENIDKLSKITINPFQVIEIPNMTSAKGFLFRNKAKKVIKQSVLSADYVVARLPSMSGFLAIDYARKFSKPYLTEVVACPWDAFWNHSFQGKLVAPFMCIATKRRVRDSVYTMYVTNEFLQKRYPTNGGSVNCSNVSLEQFDDKVLNNRIKKINSFIKKKKIIIGTTASIDVRYKGQQYIIQALGEMKKRGIDNFEYQLVGAGNRSYLESVAKENDVMNQVKFLGPMLHKKVFEWLETIDVYAQPSRQEGLPRALIEAMSRGVPAIGARTAGIPELLSEECIFSNTKNNIIEIMNLLNEYTTEKMEDQARRNFNEAKKYDKNIIEKKRKEFFKEFANNNKKVK